MDPNIMLAVVFCGFLQIAVSTSFDDTHQYFAVSNLESTLEIYRDCMILVLTISQQKIQMKNEIGNKLELLTTMTTTVDFEQDKIPILVYDSVHFFNKWNYSPESLRQVTFTYSLRSPQFQRFEFRLAIVTFSLRILNQQQKLTLMRSMRTGFKALNRKSLSICFLVKEETLQSFVNPKDRLLEWWNFSYELMIRTVTKEIEDKSNTNSMTLLSDQTELKPKNTWILEYFGHQKLGTLMPLLSSSINFDVENVRTQIISERSSRQKRLNIDIWPELNDKGLKSLNKPIDPSLNAVQ
jgi:hypothetical protein